MPNLILQKHAWRTNTLKVNFKIENMQDEVFKNQMQMQV